MSQRTVTLSEREQIYLKKMAGQTLPQIAQTLGLSEACVRKWWRWSGLPGVAGVGDGVADDL